MNLLARTFRGIAAGIAVVVLTALSSVANAASPTIEILAFSHWPVQNALKPVREVLAKYEGKIKVVELDVDKPEGAARLKAVGLKGHIPVVIIVDGQFRHRRPDGTTIEFMNFPAAATASPMGLDGKWRAEDVEAVIKERLK